MISSPFKLTEETHFYSVEIAAVEELDMDMRGALIAYASGIHPPDLYGAALADLTLYGGEDHNVSNKLRSVAAHLNVLLADPGSALYIQTLVKIFPKQTDARRLVLHFGDDLVTHKVGREIADRVVRFCTAPLFPGRPPRPMGRQVYFEGPIELEYVHVVHSVVLREIVDLLSVDSQSPTAGSQQPTADSGQPTADSGHPTADSGQPTAGSQQSVAGSQQPTADSEQPSAAAPSGHDDDSMDLPAKTAQQALADAKQRTQDFLDAQPSKRTLRGTLARWITEGRMTGGIALPFPDSPASPPVDPSTCTWTGDTRDLPDGCMVEDVVEWVYYSDPRRLLCLTRGGKVFTSRQVDF
jgi:hypothetical protein